MKEIDIKICLKKIKKAKKILQKLPWCKKKKKKKNQRRSLSISVLTKKKLNSFLIFWV